MLKKILITILLAAAATILFKIGFDYYHSHLMTMSVMVAPPPPVGIEAGPIKVVVDENTSWMAISKALVTVLGTYLGIKLINKYVKA